MGVKSGTCLRWTATNGVNQATFIRHYGHPSAYGFHGYLALGLRDLLPIVPVPLRPPDAAVCLDLSLALTSIHDEATYDLSIDYSQSPPPPIFSEADTSWMHVLLRKS
jgi:hypothetical protein